MYVKSVRVVEWRCSRADLDRFVRVMGAIRSWRSGL
jgi:hypothetical protein